MIPLTLYAYEHSVYSWIARLALAFADKEYAYVEIDPFSDNVPNSFLALNPWQRVPVLQQGDFILYETVAITSYINDQFADYRLTPNCPVDRATMRQIISIVDSYGYWPMVRQVFSNRFYQPIMGELSDHEALYLGLLASKKVLAAIDPLIARLGPLEHRELTLADIHLAPILDYYLKQPEVGRQQKPNIESGRSEGGNLRRQAADLASFVSLQAWWSNISTHALIQTTRPVFS